MEKRKMLSHHQENTWSIMQLEVIQNIHDLDGLAQEWNDLLGCCSASHVPFLRHEYLSTWWRSLGGGEWQQAELYSLLGRDETGALLGIAPLFFAPNREGIPALLLLGSIEISDYLDLIAKTSELPAFVEALFDHLAGPGAPGWQALDWYNLPETSPTLEVLKAAAQKRGWKFSQQTLQPCPHIPLPGDWETYLASIDKKQRHEIRRKMRRAEESETPVRWYIVEDQTSLDSEIEDFMALMAQDPEKAAFLTQVMRSQMRSAVHAAFKAGWLQLAFLKAGGKKAAGYLNFDYAGHIWVYNSGLNFEMRELSPGWVLLGELLKWANENKRLSFDFMRGNEDYKYRFGGVNRFVVRALIERSDPPVSIR
jgi:CelD/BcsL family acetyltransferase involved in cellulose biosynthesis